MREFNKEDRPIINDDYELLVVEGIRLCNEIDDMLHSVTNRLQSEIIGP